MRDKIRSLTRNEIKVLYRKCKGEMNKQIAPDLKKSIKWVEGQKTNIYRKLGIPKSPTDAEVVEFLKVNKVCETLHQLVKTPRDLNSWPLYGFFGKKEPDKPEYDWRKEMDTLAADQLLSVLIRLDSRIDDLISKQTDQKKKGRIKGIKQYRQELEKSAKKLEDGSPFEAEAGERETESVSPLLGPKEREEMSDEKPQRENVDENDEQEDHIPHNWRKEMGTLTFRELNERVYAYKGRQYKILDEMIRENPSGFYENMREDIIGAHDPNEDFKLLNREELVERIKILSRRLIELKGEELYWEYYEEYWGIDNYWENYESIWGIGGYGEDEDEKTQPTKALTGEVIDEEAEKDELDKWVEKQRGKQEEERKRKQGNS